MLEPALAIDKVEGRSSHPIIVKLEAQGKPLVMEVDTGAAVSIISEETYDTLFSQVTVKQASVALHTYTGVNCNIWRNFCRRCLLWWSEKDTFLSCCQRQMSQFVWQTLVSTLSLGLENYWLSYTWESSTTLDMLLERYADAFAEGLGSIQHLQVKLHVKEGTCPMFSDHGQY